MNEESRRILEMVAAGKISAEEAERLLDAVQRAGTGQDINQAANPETKKTPKFMYVKVVSANDDNVDVKVPLSLVRAGLRLTSLIPPQAMDHINESMEQHGMSFDLSNLKPDDI
jgi:hypothetical protein